MDSCAVVIPIPVQPIEPAPQAPGNTAPPQDAAEGEPDFATALEQQLSQAPADAPGLPPPPRLLRTTDDAETPASRDEDPEATTPDALIALLAAPLYPQHAAPAAPVARESALPATAPAAKGDGGVAAATGDRRAARDSAASRTEPLPFGVADPSQSGHGRESEARAAAPAHAAPDLAAAAALIHPGETTRPVHAAPAHAAVRPEPAIPARVGTPEWNDGLTQQVTLMVRDGEQTAQLRLDPPELGPLEVRLSITQGDDAVAQVQFVSAHAPVRDALEAALPQLRAALAESGITLGQASVGEGYARDDGRNFAQPGAGAGRGGEEAAAVPGMPGAIVKRGLVDTFA